MKQVYILSLILILILIVASTSIIVSQTQNDPKTKEAIFVGVSFNGNTAAEAKLLIDRVKSYTNLFILQSGQGPVSKNETVAREIIDYAVNSGLAIIVNLGTRDEDETYWSWHLKLYLESREKYGNQFLGVYYDDEPAGIPFDWDWSAEFTKNSSFLFRENRLSLKPVHYRIEMAKITGERPENYTVEALWYRTLAKINIGFNDLKRNNIKTFTSDYLLYWFDYAAGYDTLLAQVGWNHSISQDLSLIRGAAIMQNKDWGVIITWKYRQYPYLDTPENIYSQMEMAYNAGAKYITIFNYPYNDTNNLYGVMTDDHFHALEKFWNEVVTKLNPSSPQAEAAFVLPKDYGWGMRSLDDKIWGFWEADDKSPLIWKNLAKLLNQYGLSLDIIYDDPTFPINKKYTKIYNWNETI